MLISYYANKKSSPRLPSWQPSLISFNTPIDSGSIIKPCTLKHFQVPILAPGLLQESLGKYFVYSDSWIPWGRNLIHICTSTQLSLVHVMACCCVKHQTYGQLMLITIVDWILRSKQIIPIFKSGAVTFQWHHNERDGISNHQPKNCLLNCLFRSRSKKHQSSVSLAFVQGMHQWTVNSLHKGPLMRKMFPFDDVIMDLTRVGRCQWFPGSWLFSVADTRLLLMHILTNENKWAKS